MDLSEGATLRLSRRKALFFGKMDSVQAHRIRRYLAAVATSGLTWLLLSLLCLAGHLQPVGLEIAGGCMVIFVALFYVLFRSGANRLASDPSLTAEMMVSAILVLTMTMYFASPPGRTIIVALLPFSFIFGLFRLSTKGFLYVAAIAIAAYGVMALCELRFRPDGVDNTLTLLDLAVLSVFSTWFSLVGGHIGRLRKQLASSKARLEEALRASEDLATRDELTGANNRRQLMGLLRNLQNGSARSGATFHVCLMDIDHFKHINDAHGHHVGDRVLREFSQEVLKHVRASDYFGRYGGEEFLLVLTNTGRRGARIAAENILQHARELRFAGSGPRLQISISIGVTEYHAGESIEQTLMRADEALYQAKGTGRDRVEAAWAA
ncbi:MAG TPA: GGDEF domain-containing protein [Burkholderiales bacterium]|nr:GGDEF domain-containing protein [Burkholderiales bacterium]